MNIKERTITMADLDQVISIKSDFYKGWRDAGIISELEYQERLSAMNSVRDLAFLRSCGARPEQETA